MQLDMPSYMQYLTFVLHAIAFRPFIYVDLYTRQSSSKFQGAQDIDFNKKYLEAILPGIRLFRAQSVISPKRVLKGKSTFKKCVSGYWQDIYTA